MKIRSVIWLAAILCICYSTLTLVVTTLEPILGSVEKYSTEKKQVILKKQQKNSFYRKQSEKIQELVADEQILQWTLVRDDYDLHQLPNFNRSSTHNQNFHLIQSENLCGLSQAFQRYRDSVLFTPSPHILWWRDRDHSKDPEQDWQNDGCSVWDIKEYLNHEDTLAVMVTLNSTGVRVLKHSKLFPMTPGVWQDKSDSLRQQLWTQIMDQLPLSRKRNRTMPVLIVGNRAQTTRTSDVKDRLSHLFGPTVRAVFHPRDDDHRVLYDNLLQAQFVVGISIGRDHDWVNEALVLGAIPILEEENIHNSKIQNLYHRQLYERLPVAWIDDYDSLTPEWIDMELEHIFHNVDYFQFERMTQIYWIDRALILLEKMEAQRKKEEEELKRSEGKKEEEKKKGKRIFRIPTI